MKTTKLFRPVLTGVVIATFAALSSCSDTGKSASHEHSEHQEEAQSSAEQGNPQFKDQKVKAVYEHYIHVKNALIKADTKEAQSGGAMLQTALTTAGSTKGAEIAAKIASASKIEEQRAQLDGLTSEVEKLIKSSKLAGGKIFKQYCPMANDGNGAFWLASENSVKNPYYGDEMLECGEVKEEIK